jgi:hypothetical protein
MKEADFFNINQCGLAREVAKFPFGVYKEDLIG